MTNHGCRFTWCTNESDAHEVHRLEHFAEVARIPATAGSLAALGRIREGYDDLPMVGVGARFNEDLEAAPTVSLSISGVRPHADTEIELRPDEAVLLYDALGLAIRNATEGTNFNAARISSFYSQSEEPW